LFLALPYPTKGLVIAVSVSKSESEKGQSLTAEAPDSEAVHVLPASGRQLEHAKEN